MEVLGRSLSTSRPTVLYSLYLVAASQSGAGGGELPAQCGDGACLDARRTAQLLVLELELSELLLVPGRLQLQPPLSRGDRRGLGGLCGQGLGVGVGGGQDGMNSQR